MDASRWRCELRSRLNHGKANVPDIGTPALALAVGGIGITSHHLPFFAERGIWWIRCWLGWAGG